MNPEVLDYYRDLERGLLVQEAVQYGPLVVANGNKRLPVHRWFRMKEAFSAGLLPTILDEIGSAMDRDVVRVVDPFAGAGTVAAAAGLQTPRRPHMDAFGVEANPFLHLLASTKHRALQQGSDGHLAMMGDVLKRSRDMSLSTTSIPELSTFHNSRYFERQELLRLLSVVASIEELEPRFSPIAADLCRIAVAGAIEPISRLRRDGRALRFEPTREPKNAVTEFKKRSHMIAEDLENAPHDVGGYQSHGDGRVLEGLEMESDPFDLALFSPPYPNNIDYTEVYKLEAWLLGYIRDQEDFRSQRLATVHSHPSIRRSTEVSPELAHIIEPVTSSVPDGRYASALSEMLTGYVRDMAATFSELHGRVKPGGDVVFVVGNSLHGAGEAALIVAADLLLTSIAQQSGFSVERIAVARRLRRRHHESRYLRESVCFLKVIS